jgi:hypothetical protein
MRLITTAAAAIAAIVAIVVNDAPALSQPAAEIETLAEKDVPGSVTSRMRCKSPAGPVTLRPFANGFVFAQSCTEGAEPLVRVIYATDRAGTGARMLQFHRPEGRRMSALATVSFFPAESEIAGTTGRLTRRICRAEGRWRMEGKQPTPGLIFWRQNAACDGDAGWQTVTGRAR